VRFADVIGLGLSALFQQKTRTALTTLGVVIGSFLLILSLAIGEGVKTAVVNELRRYDQIRKILVWQGTQVTEEQVPKEMLEVKGEISEEKRERLRQAIMRRYRGKMIGRPRRLLTRDNVHELARLDHVESVVPNLPRGAYVAYGDKEESVLTVAADHENRAYRSRIVAGSYFAPGAHNELIVSEYLLYRWGIVEDDAVESALGQTVVLEHPSEAGPGPGGLLSLMNTGRASLSAEEGRVLEKVIGQLPKLLAETDLTAAEKKVLAGLLRTAKPSAKGPGATIRKMKIVGVIRDPTRHERLLGWEGLLSTFDAIVPAKAAEEMFFSDAAHKDAAFGQVTVRVDSEDNLKSVQQQISDMGYETYSLAELVDQVRFNVLIVSLSTAFMALVALVVAGLGITNTMLMSVLERTHEIGVMKAVGARDRHILGLFLIEGALIGAVGSCLGVLLSYLASFPGDRVAHSIVARKAQLQLEGSLFVFPWWLMVGVPMLVTLLTMLSAYYPARRAARVNPITALRHE
jgi:putative ABC transport system permease protein